MIILVLIEEETVITEETLVDGTGIEEAIGMTEEEEIVMTETTTAMAEVAMVGIVEVATTSTDILTMGTQLILLRMDWLGTKTVPNFALSTLLEVSAHKWRSRTHASAIKTEPAALRLGPTPAYNARCQVL